MTCVKTVEILENFLPLRGLQQGDPLSLYLFMLVADGLSRLLQKEIDNGKIKDLIVCRHIPGISHLLFADDSRSSRNVHQANKIKLVLNKHEKATGQLLSPGKCSLTGE